MNFHIQRILILSALCLVLGCEAKHETTGEFLPTHSNILGLTAYEMVESDFMWVETDDGTGIAELKIYASLCQTEAITFGFLLTEAKTKSIDVISPATKGIKYSLIKKSSKNNPNLIADIAAKKFFEINIENEEILIGITASIDLYQMEEDGKLQLIGHYYSSSKSLEASYPIGTIDPPEFDEFYGHSPKRFDSRDNMEPEQEFKEKKGADDDQYDPLNKPYDPYNPIYKTPFNEINPYNRINPIYKIKPMDPNGSDGN